MTTCMLGLAGLRRAFGAFPAGVTVSAALAGRVPVLHRELVHCRLAGPADHLDLRGPYLLDMRGWTAA
jgi:hypothetical protein